MVGGPVFSWRFWPYFRLALTRAVERAEQNPTEANLAKVKEAQYNFHTSPDGIRELRKAGKELDAQHFEKVREVAVAFQKADQAKQARARKEELTYLYSEAGIEEVRSQGNDDLADRLLERRNRATLRKGGEAGVIFKADFMKPTASSDDIVFQPPSVATAILVGAVHGAMAGFRSKNGGLAEGIKTGMSAGKAQQARVDAQLEEVEKQKQQTQTARIREDEKAQRAYEKEQARIAREEERLRRADETWHRRLEADCLRYLNQQERQARENEKHQPQVA
jgi:hypothetical protein